MPRKFQLEQLGSDPASQAAWGTHQRALSRIGGEMDTLEEGVRSFAPAVAGDWSGTPPTTIAEALNRIAASITANHGTGP